MALLAIPLDENLPWYSFSITLENQAYTFEVAYNTRANRWMLSISDAADNLILAGIPLLIERDLLRPYRTLRLPPGSLVVLDNTGQGQEPTLGSFLLNHTLYYLESTS
ncbi:MAG: hypothetical protein EOO40_07125 [Deltaproteobacteria bacterium]|nr:MAG: hypothetical protein EOO40_07125 [Deltaproteobacteria bacterium]